MTTRSLPVQFRDAAVEAELDRRGPSRGKTASRDLARYYRVLGRELDLVDLTPKQWGAVRAALANHGPDQLAESAELGMAVGDWLAVVNPLSGEGPARYRDGWTEAEAGQLLSLLLALPPVRALAIVDAAERWRG